MNWFQHDADSTQDAKIKKLLIRHGAIGYAVYFHCLELIIGDVCETNITFELEHDSEIIADNLKISGTGDKSGREIVEEIMRTIVDLGLFTNENGHIFCYKLLKRINMSMTSNKALRDAISSAKVENHDEIMTHHDNVMIPTYLPTNPPTKAEKPPKQPKEFIPPTQEQIEVYVLEKQLVITPQDFFTYYSLRDWHDSTGKKVGNWKNRVLDWHAREIKKNPAAVPYSKPKPREEYRPKNCKKCGSPMTGLSCPSCYTNFDSEGNEV